MRRSGLSSFTIASAVVMVVGFLGVDRPLANWVHGSGYEGMVIFSKGTTWLDVVSGKDVSKFLPGGVLTIVGLVLLVVYQVRRVGVAWLYVGITSLSSVWLVGMLKNVFGRLRPYEMFERNLDGTVWFAKGSSFPSGHTAYYFGVFLPLAYLFPKWRWPLLVIPFFIAAARINEGHHFLSDVAGSMVIMGCFALGLSTAFGRWIGSGATTSGEKEIDLEGATPSGSP